MKNHFRDNLLFILISTTVYLAEPAVVQAQGGHDPVPFDRSLNLSRAEFSPASEGGVILPQEIYCPMLTEEWGWNDCRGVDEYIYAFTPQTDSVLFTTPNSEGYVEFSDWYNDDKESAISQIRDELDSGLRAQGKRLGQTIKFDKWLVYPTLDEARKILFYAYVVNWGSDPIVNAKVSLFDRKGYTTALVVPADSNLSRGEMTGIVYDIASNYQSTVGEEYEAFTTGEKVAAAGAVGVLASLVGVKYGKAVASGLLAVALAFAKKLWFLVFLPFIFLGKLFRKRD